MNSQNTGTRAEAPSAPPRPEVRAGQGGAAMLRGLAPSILGLALARSGLIVGSYGSYAQTDLGIYTDGSMLGTLMIMGVLLIILAASKARIRRSTVTLITQACIISETALLIAQGVITLEPGPHEEALFALSVLLSLVSSGAMFFWLRRAKGAPSGVAVAYVFGALIASEVLLEGLSLIDDTTALFIAAVGSLAQLGCMGAAFNSRPLSSLSAGGSMVYFGYTRALINDKRFLVSTAIGIGLLGLVVGLLRGYPDGLPIPFTTATRAGYAGLTILISLAVIAVVLRGSRRAMTMGIWVTLELLACLSLVAFAAFPQALQYGALFATTLNALMVGLVWYTVIAFESHGWRDPYYYAMAGWIVWLGCRGVARMTLLLVYPLCGDDLLVNSVMGMMLLISTQVVFGSCLRDAGSQCGLAALDVPVPAPASRVAAEAGRGGVTGEPPTGSARSATAPTPASVAAPADDAPVGPSADEIRASILASMEEDAPAYPFDPTRDARAAATPAEPAPPLPDLAGFPPDARRLVREAVAAPASPTPPLGRLMGLDEDSSVVTCQQSQTGRRVMEMGHRFMLSEREIEVLTLYALGYTQKRVAEELHISQGTAHTHIKRIYAKTGMHSRQDILDYLSKYGDECP